MLLDETDDVNGSPRLRDFEKTVALLTRENEALRTVLARLHQENIRLAETLLRATSAERTRSIPNENQQD
jgi:hypothetical protein